MPLIHKRCTDDHATSQATFQNVTHAIKVSRLVLWPSAYALFAIIMFDDDSGLQIGYEPLH